MSMLLALLLAGEPLVTTKMADPDPGFVAPRARAKAPSRPKAAKSAEEELVRFGVAMAIAEEDEANRKQQQMEREVADLEAMIRKTEQAAADAPQR